MDKNKAAKERIIKGHKLSCTVCKDKMFRARETVMNTRGMTPFNLDRANKSA